MAIWLFCQSCKQWSKSTSSLSDDKSCPMCSNLYINSKPVVSSGPSSIVIEQVQDSPVNSLTASSNETQPDVQETPETAETDEDAGSPETADEAAIEEEAELDSSRLEEAAEASEAPTAKASTEAPEDVDKQVEDEPAETIDASQAVVETAAPKTPRVPEKPEKPERTKTADTHVIQVAGKPLETPDNLEPTQTSVKPESVDTLESTQPKKRQIRPR